MSSIHPWGSTGGRLVGRLALVLGAAAMLALAVPARAKPVNISANDFYLYRSYQLALQDPRVIKMAPRRRLPAIARNFKVSLRALKRAIAAGEAAGPDLLERCEERVRAILDQSPLKGRVRDVSLDPTDGHVVAYVKWANTDGRKLDQEASWAAMAAVKGAPIAWTVAVWAVDSRTGQNVFQAKISAASASLFSAGAIPLFATARYIRMFEDVKNAYLGNPPPASPPSKSPD